MRGDLRYIRDGMKILVPRKAGMYPPWVQSKGSLAYMVSVRPIKDVSAELNIPNEEDQRGLCFQAGMDEAIESHPLRKSFIQVLELPSHASTSFLLLPSSHLTKISKWRNSINQTIDSAPILSVLPFSSFTMTGSNIILYSCVVNLALYLQPGNWRPNILVLHFQKVI